MVSLGISAFYHDSAVCLFEDGKVIVAIEEEKLSGIKHDSSFPIKAIKWVLQQSNKSISDIDTICWYEDPQLKYDRVKNTLGKRWWKNRKLWKKFKEEFESTEGDLTMYLAKKLNFTGNIEYVKHHNSHLAFSYYTSPFQTAVGISIDGVGEWETALAVRCKDNTFEEIKSVAFPHSLGLVYSTITAYLGFKPNNGEYKVMGLAPYGDPSVYKDIFDRIARLDTGGTFEINQKYFTWQYSNTDMYTYDLVKLIGFEPREAESAIEQKHMDLAAALQKWYESYFYFFVNHCMQQSDSSNLVLGGGSAYNGTANGKIQKHTSVKELWIPFAPSDAGSAIGACLYHWHNTLGNPKVVGGDNQSPYLGPEWNNKQLLDIILKNRNENNKPLNVIKYDSIEMLCTDVAHYINDGNIIGWFQGRTEFGARALGNRSILGNPHLPDIRDRINRVVKKREMFRPFAPSVTFEDYNKYFISEGEVPYMNQVVKVTDYKSIPSVTHVDGSARIQTVRKELNPLYYNLLKEFEKVSGTPILLNTSFNLRGHTMTNDPQKAIWTFLNCDMDYLVIGNYLISK
jgi:carbamoyltransferase